MRRDVPETKNRIEDGQEYDIMMHARVRLIRVSQFNS